MVESKSLNTTSAAPPPTSFLGYLRSFGPGIVIALSWVGTGDLIDNSVAGGNYGYALLWVLPLSLVFRFLFVNSLAKYPLYNVQNDSSIVRGFARTHPVFGWLMLISFVLYTHLLLAFSFSGVGVALHGLFGGLPPFWWSVIGAISVFAVTFRGAYGVLENTFKVVLAVMVGAFVVGVVMVGINWPELVRGFAFELPPQSGLFDSSLVASSLVLATRVDGQPVLPAVPAGEGLGDPGLPPCPAVRPAVRLVRGAVPRRVRLGAGGGGAEHR